MSKLDLSQAIDLTGIAAEAPTPEPKASQLPEPKGYRILCAVPDADDKYESGIVKASDTKRIEENGTVVLFVLKMGDLCYKEEAKFPTGAWCKEGDFVLTRAYAGTRFKIHGREFRIINDDTVEGVVDDPRGYTRAQEKYMAAQPEFDDDFEFPDEKEVSTVNTKDEVSITLEEDNTEVEIDIIDDTPPQDRDRKPLPKEIVEELEKDDLTDYSDRVKERMAQLRKVYHDERRDKEAAAREREEAIRYAQSIQEENKRLKSSLTSGEQTYIEIARKAAEQEMNMAKRDYREAYDRGETDNIIDAQQRMNEAQYKLTQMQNYRPQYDSALQAEENDVYIQPERPQIAKPDRKALAWQDKNSWFGQDEEMTSLALGLHEKLVRAGTNPTSEEYYTTIDKTMRKRFPEYFGDDSLDVETPAQRKKPSTVVAPASRSTAPKKVHLTKTQLALAKKFNLTPEQYARETLKLENR